MTEFGAVDPFADDLEQQEAALSRQVAHAARVQFEGDIGIPFEGARVKCPTCTNILEAGDTCEDCQRERKMDTGQWGPAIDRLARAGYSPHIEHFKGAGPRSGYRVSIWPSVNEPRIDLGYAYTFEGAVELLVNWKIPA